MKTSSFDQLLTSHESTLLELARECDFPFYFIDLDAVRNGAIAFRDVWKNYFESVRIAYSFKSNPLKAITQTMLSVGIDAEVVSGTELAWALSDGFCGEKIIFNGPIKLRDELDLALATGSTINVDCLSELRTILELLDSKRPSPILHARLAHDIDDDQISRFGFSSEELISAIALLDSRGMRFSGFHIHTGSNLPNPSPTINSLRELSRLRREGIIPNAASLTLDIGGGFPADSFGPNGAPLGISSFAAGIRMFLESSHLLSSIDCLIVEPGRCLVEHFGVIVGRVRAIKNRGAGAIAITDLGRNQIRSLPLWFHPIRVLRETATRDGGSESVGIYGWNCFEEDVIASVNQPVHEGDLIVVGNAGGYDIPSANGWTRSLPPIFAWSGGSLIQARRTQESSLIRAADVAILEKSPEC